MKIEYQTQRLSMRFFMLMLFLFVLQIIFGMIVGLQQVDPNLLVGKLNFNVARTEHINLGLLWILTGFIGTILFVGPALSRRELAHPWLIHVLFYALIAAVLWNVYAQGLAMKGVAGWWGGQAWFQEGLEYIEGGRIFDIVALIGFGILGFVLLRTFPSMKEWNEIHWGLAIGVVALAVVWLFGLFYVSRLDLQEYFRWFVVHYWVEGVWEVIHISLIGFLLVKMFDADVKSVGYAVFWGVILVWLSGLIGNAHHYFWIGTPEFWQFWGSLFSAFEPLPLIFCFWHIYLDAHQNNKPLKNAPAFYFMVGSVVLEQVGAGILGFTMTFALTNVWSHGTWITPAHGHLALFGTFGMLVIGAAYYAVPLLRGATDFDQRLGKLAFWLLFLGISGMALAFAWGGTVQMYVYRTLGLEWFGGDVFPALDAYKIFVPLFGFVTAIGCGVLVYDLVTIGRIGGRKQPEIVNRRKAQPTRGWSRPFSGFEAGIWLVLMWIFGFVITFGILSFNLSQVRIEGNPTVPYTMAAIGYPGLLLVTALFVWRFLASLESRIENTESK